MAQSGYEAEFRCAERNSQPPHGKCHIAACRFAEGVLTELRERVAIRLERLGIDPIRNAMNGVRVA